MIVYMMLLNSLPAVRDINHKYIVVGDNTNGSGYLL